MKAINQLSVFMENRAGQLAEIIKILSDEGIDMRALNVAETSDYGILRVIVDDEKKASQRLLSEGYVVAMNQVFGIAVPDRPGGLEELLEMLAAGGVDIEYMYSALGLAQGTAYMVICAKNPEIMQSVIERNAIE